MDPIMKIGQPAPLFELPDIYGITHSLRNDIGRMTVINFWSADCPWSKRVDEAISSLQVQWGKNVVYLPIAANANEPPELVRAAASERGLFTVLLDANHRVADAYGALTTPHIFLIDAIGILRYQGAFDDVTFKNATPSAGYLEGAIEALLNGENPNPVQTDPYGCTIVRSNEA